MASLTFLISLALAALLVAWISNSLVALLSGERPPDTGRLAGETFLRLFAMLELGLFARVLNGLGFTGRRRKFVLFLGMVCVLVFLVRAGRPSTPSYSCTYTLTNEHIYEPNKP